MLPDHIENQPIKSKSISDPIYGFIQLEEDEVELIDTPQIQRLRNVKQLGLSHLTYPSACHSRFGHTLGVLHVTQKMLDNLDLDEEEVKLNRIAAILHDTGHGPFSHASEQIQGEDIKHTDYSCKIAEELEHKINCDVEKVKDMIRGERKENNLIQGAINSDRMDYLMRDSHHTGVQHGQIDNSKIMESIMKYNNKLVFNSRATSSIENLLTSRYSMYKAVYKHQTCRASEKMLTLCMDELIDKLGKEKVVRMTDEKFKSESQKHLTETKEILEGIENRKLYKPCYEINNINTDKNILKYIEENIDQKKLREQIAKETDLDKKYIIVDPITEPKKIQNINIYENNKVYDLKEFSGITEGLDMWELEKLSVFTPKEYRHKVGKQTKKILSDKIEH